MNCKEANKLSIVGYLASQGINPAKQNNDQVWYCSPLRNETTPSFKVNQSLNLWYDFGSGENGTLIDLVCKLTGSSVSGALLQLQKPNLQPIHFISGKQKENQSPKISIKTVKPIQAKFLKDYIVSRGISLKLANYYLKEIIYERDFGNGKKGTFHNLGFKNDLNGYELRNTKDYKGCTSKAVTTFSGYNRSEVNLFEGSFDFLTAIEYPGLKILSTDNIVLNTVYNLPTVIQRLSEYQKINLFLDNDNSGRKTSNWIIANYSNVTNYAEIIYPGFKDFNEYYCSPGKSE